MDYDLWHLLKRIGETHRGELLKLPVALTILALGPIVESRIDKNISGDVAIELKGYRVLPL